MAEASSGGEKTEQPTPKKLRDARDEGQVAFSHDLNVAVLLLVALATLGTIGPKLAAAFGVIMRDTVTDHLQWELTAESSVRLLILSHLPAFVWFGVLLAVLFGTALAISIAQVGVGFTFKPLVPKFSRVNPLSGLGRLFGMRGVMRFVFSLSKLIIVLALAWSMLRTDINDMLYFNGELAQRLAHDSGVLLTEALKMAAVLALIAAGDYAYQRYQHVRDMMMTKQEVKDEYKQSEGDPHVKGRIRQMQREMAKKRMMQEVPKADVVITNPTHVAVALKYQADAMAAPIVIAKGYDEVAQRIKAIAAEHGITMVENIPLARALAKEVEIGHPIPGRWYQAVAEVLSVVYKLKRKSA